MEDMNSADESDQTDPSPNTFDNLNRTEVEVYKYLDLPVSLIPKSLANYEPPKFGSDFPFLSIGRLYGREYQYAQGRFNEQRQGFVVPEGSLNSLLDRKDTNIVYSRNRQLDDIERNNLNVRKLVADTVKPPGQKEAELSPYYSLKSLDDTTLVFESRFESGNLNLAMKRSETDYDLMLQNDINSRGNTQWYYFSVTNTSQDLTVRFNIINFSKSDSLYNYGMRVLVYSEMEKQMQGTGWFRDGNNIQYFANGIKRGKLNKSYYTLTFTYKFPHRGDTVYFAYAQPYTYSDCLEDLINIEAASPGILSRKLLIPTLAGNRCEVLTVTAPGTVAQVSKRKGAVITARVHPGESVGSWMMKGVLDFIISDNPEARELRKLFVFKIVPMLNPDGVIVGNYRTSLVGADLNRRWKTPSKLLHPTIWATKNMIKEFSKERKIDMVCDLHGHSRRKNVFMYGCNIQNHPQITRIIPYIMGKISPFFKYGYSRFKMQRSKESTMRISVFRDLRIQCVYTMESTFWGADEGEFANMHMSCADLQSMGKSLLQALLIKAKDQKGPDPEEPSPNPSDLAGPLNLGSVMDELMNDESLLNMGEQCSDTSGSDSDPSEDNLDPEELNKQIPPSAGSKSDRNNKRQPTKKRTIIRNYRSLSATKPNQQPEPRKCPKWGEVWGFRHKCAPKPKPPPPQSPPKATQTRPAQPRPTIKQVGLRTYYNSNGKKVHDQATQTPNSVIRQMKLDAAKNNRGRDLG